MELIVVKIGLPMFDVLHTYGLGVLLAMVSGQPVNVTDARLTYTVSSSMSEVPDGSCSILDLLFILPEPDELFAFQNGQQKLSPSIAILDGLLAALYTSPGSPEASVWSLLNRQRLDPSAVQKGLLKVTKRIRHWKNYVEREQKGKTGWLADMLRDYTPTNPAVPFLAEGHPKQDVHALMTLDPSLGYSYRRPFCDGNLTKKSNSAVRGTRYAALLAMLGASRFLRAQPLASRLVNFYVPLAAHIELHASITLPILTPEACPPDQAVIRSWLSLVPAEQPREIMWHGLSYQRMQRQPLHQAITIESGYLDGQWLATITRQAGRGIVFFWSAWLAHRDGNTFDEQEHLVECLKRRSMDAWWMHLHDVFHRLVIARSKDLRQYRLEEVRRITRSMEENNAHPLRTVLERNEGTLRFGRALRLLGAYNPSALRDLIEMLECVQTEEQLLPVLYRIIQECILASAKSRYIIIPSDDDLPYLLDDLHRYGVRVLIGLLMVLSVLRYPHTDGVDKYEIYTLIGTLLLLARQNILFDQGSQEGTPHLLETFSGEPSHQLPLREGEHSDDH